MTRWLLRIVVLALLVAGGYVLSETVFEPEPVEVETHAVGIGRVEDTVTNSKAGTVEARRRAWPLDGDGGHRRQPRGRAR